MSIMLIATLLAAASAALSVYAVINTFAVLRYTKRIYPEDAFRLHAARARLRGVSLMLVRAVLLVAAFALMPPDLSPAIGWLLSATMVLRLATQILGEIDLRRTNED